MSPRALRVVLVLALDRARVASCLGIDPLCTAEIWPSTLYAWAAEAAARSPRVFARCVSALDEALSPWLAPYEDESAAHIAELLSPRECGASMRGEEIAAALWVLVRRSEPRLAPIVERLAAEAEILVAQGCGANARFASASLHDRTGPRRSRSDHSRLDRSRRRS